MIPVFSCTNQLILLLFSRIFMETISSNTMIRWHLAETSRVRDTLFLCLHGILQSTQLFKTISRSLQPITRHFMNHVCEPYRTYHRSNMFKEYSNLYIIEHFIPLPSLFQRFSSQPKFFCYPLSPLYRSKDTKMNRKNSYFI